MKNISFISIGFINNHFFGWDNNSNKTEEEIINYLKNLDYSPLNDCCRFVENNFNDDYRNVSGQFQTQPLAFVIGKRSVKNTLFTKTFARYEEDTILHLENFKAILSIECLKDIFLTIEKWDGK